MRIRVPDQPNRPTTVDQMCDRIMAIAEQYYRSPADRSGNRHPTGEAKNIRAVLNVLREVAGSKDPHDLDVWDFDRCQAVLLDRRLPNGRRMKRRTINKYMSTIGRVLRAAASPRLAWVTPAVLAAISAVPPLEFGREDAPESIDVEPVEYELVTSTMAVIPPNQMHLYLMLDLHWHTGMRPGELVRMRQSEIRIERAKLATGGVCELMVYSPWLHKTRHRNHDRNIFLSPEARRIVEDRMANLRRDEDRLWPYGTAGTYREMIIRINRKHGLPHWTPNQIRHAFATRMRAAAGIDVVQVLMGHRNRRTTEIYARPDASAAIEAILKFG